MLKMNLKKKAILIVAGILFTVIGINSVVITFLASHKYRKVILAKTASLGEGNSKINFMACRASHRHSERVGP